MRGWHGVLVFVAMTSVGCLEANRVTTAVDVRTLLASEILHGEYSAPAGAPEAARRTDPKHVSISARLREGEVESVGARMRVHFRQDAGHAGARVAVFVGDADSSVYAGEPILVLEAALAPGMERDVEREVEADARLLQLLRDDRFYVGCEFVWRVTGDSEAVGHYEVEELQLEIVSTIGGLLGSAEPRVQEPLPHTVEDSP